MPSDLESQLWRLHHLYSCREEGTGKALPFIVRPEQELLFKHLIETPHIPAYIIKSRRLGISTAVETFNVDCAVFNQGWRGVLIDQKQDDATKKMVEIIRFAVDSLPPEILSGFTFDKRNDSELRLRFKDEKESEDSVIFATTGNRGGDCSFLHISEWGPIAATDPTRSREIRTGAFPAARLGRRVVETTWYGGRVGDLWDLIKPIMQKDPNSEGIIYFFPWHADPAAIKVQGVVTRDIELYFKDLASKLNKDFTREQKHWYAAKKLEQGIFVKREYPSTLEEAFEAPVEGAVYADKLMEIRGQGRIRPIEWDRAFPVYASWDIGWNDTTAIWFFQVIANAVFWIRHIEEKGRSASEMATVVRETKIPIARHYLPHDAGASHANTGTNYAFELQKAGIANTTILPRTMDIWNGINQLRDIIPRSWFNITGCDAGIAYLDSYHTKPATAGGAISREPVHDISSNTADAARYAAEALALGIVNDAAKPQAPRQVEIIDGNYDPLERDTRGRRRQEFVSL
jgi:hypothetical protein